MNEEIQQHPTQSPETEDAKAERSIEPSELGVISPIGIRPCCCKCDSPIDRDVTTADEILRVNETICPRFCPNCERWFHRNCLTKSKSTNCPDCGKRMLIANYFYCSTCARHVGKVKKGSWPNILCIKCGNPTSLAALDEFVGLGGLFAIGAIGFVFLITFISRLPGRGDLLWQLQQLDASDPLTIIAGIPTALLAIPWVVLCAGFVLTSGAYPTHFSLLIRQGRDLKMKSRWKRLLEVYLWAVTLGASRKKPTKGAKWRDVAVPQCPNCGSTDIRRAGPREFGIMLAVSGVFAFIFIFLGFALGWPSWIMWGFGGVIANFMFQAFVQVPKLRFCRKCGGGGFGPPSSPSKGHK